MTILFAILLFSLLVFVHELGHFVAAKLSGVQVNEFAVFMGPALVKWERNGTLYSIRCIPFGGYCAMEGEDGDSDNPRAFTRAAWWKRLIILVAGAFMNFVAGLFLLMVVYLPAQQMIVPEIAYMEEGCLLSGEDGLQVGDRFLSIDGEKIYVQSDFSMLMSIYGGEYHDVEILRDGKKVFLDDFRMQRAEFPNADGTTSMRYGFSFDIQDLSFVEKLKTAWFSALDYVRITRLSLSMLFTGQADMTDVSGPVGIVQQMTETAEQSATTFAALMNLLNFGAMISVNLAVMNLLPIPALDGGRVVGVVLTTAVEAVTGKKLDPKYEGYIHGAGMILLLALMALILFKDIFTIFKG
jgi:regulator of sigma E protease